LEVDEAGLMGLQPGLAPTPLLSREGKRGLYVIVAQAARAWHPWKLRTARRHTLGKVITEATITCPECGAARRETMPENACKHFYTCTSCGTTLKPRQSDCCVFCSYSDQICPPRQHERP
jgi:hypothetical protein